MELGPIGYFVLGCVGRGDGCDKHVDPKGQMEGRMEGRIEGRMEERMEGTHNTHRTSVIIIHE